jgi:hypothetical protein
MINDKSVAHLRIFKSNKLSSRQYLNSEIY